MFACVRVRIASRTVTWPNKKILRVVCVRYGITVIGFGIKSIMPNGVEQQCIGIRCWNFSQPGAATLLIYCGRTKIHTLCNPPLIEIRNSTSSTCADEDNGYVDCVCMCESGEDNSPANVPRVSRGRHAKGVRGSQPRKLHTPRNWKRRQPKHLPRLGRSGPWHFELLR